MGIHEKAEDRGRQDAIGNFLAQKYGMTWEGTDTLCPVDGYLHKEGCIAAVEIKWRTAKYEDYRIDVEKIENLLAHANEHHVMPMLVVRTPDQLWMRAVTQADLDIFDTDTMTLNKPRDPQDINDPVLVYPWEAFQLLFCARHFTSP